MTTEASLGRAALLAGEVHVWPLLIGAGTAAEMAPLLTPDEKEHSERYVFSAGQESFVAGRGLLRRVLGDYLDTDPRRLLLKADRHGKPRLAGRWAGDLDFSVSHSGAIVLVAVGRGSVGIDVEEIRGDVAYEQIVSRFFSAAEREALESLPAASRMRAFFNCWVRKEAYVKAKGLGLTMDFAGFTVSLLPAEPARLVSCRAYPQDLERWKLHGLSPAVGYTAAVAAEDADTVRKFAPCVVAKAGDESPAPLPGSQNFGIFGIRPNLAVSSWRASSSSGRSSSRNSGPLPG